MKLKKTLAGLFVGSLLLAGFAFAAPDAAAGAAGAHASKCCAKSAKEGKSCTHECCVAAAKEGNNCTKCGGAGKIADNKKAEAKH